MPNRFVPIGPDSSLQDALRVINGNFAQLDNEAVNKVFKGPNNTNALIEGKLPQDVGYGFQFSDTEGTPRIAAYIDSNNEPKFRISEAGANAITATDDQLIFNSDQNIFKIVTTDTATIPSVTISNPGSGNYNSNDSTVSVPLPTGVSGVPGVFAWLEIFNSGTSKNNYYQLPYSSPSGFSTAAVFYNAYFYVDDTNVTFGQGALCHGAGTTLGEVNVKYYILQESAN